MGATQSLKKGIDDGNLSLVIESIKNGADVNARDTKSGATASKYARDNGQHGIAAFLDAHMLLMKNDSGESPEGHRAVTLAARWNYGEQVGACIGKRFDINAVDRAGAAALHYAAEAGHVNIVRRLIAAGADVNVVNRWGQTPLFLSVTQEVTPETAGDSIMAALLAGGADVNIAAKSGVTPLMRAVTACKDGSVDSVSTLIHARANPSAADNSGSTALHMAVQLGQCDATELLLKACANVDAATTQGVTPLMAAAGKGQIDLATTLINFGARVNATSPSGNSALLLACECADRTATLALLQQLLPAGAAIAHADRGGETALWKCATRHDLAAVQCLLDHGARVEPASDAERDVRPILDDAGVKLVTIDKPSQRPGASSTPSSSSAAAGGSAVSEPVLARRIAESAAPAGGTLYLSRNPYTYPVQPCDGPAQLAPAAAAATAAAAASGYGGAASYGGGAGMQPSGSFGGGVGGLSAGAAGTATASNTLRRPVPPPRPSAGPGGAAAAATLGGGGGGGSPANGPMSPTAAGGGGGAFQQQQQMMLRTSSFSSTTNSYANAPGNGGNGSPASTVSASTLNRPKVALPLPVPGAVSQLPLPQPLDTNAPPSFSRVESIMSPNVGGRDSPPPPPPPFEDSNDDAPPPPASSLSATATAAPRLGPLPIPLPVPPQQTQTQPQQTHQSVAVATRPGHALPGMALPGMTGSPRAAGGGFGGVGGVATEPAGTPRAGPLTFAPAVTSGFVASDGGSAGLAADRRASTGSNGSGFVASGGGPALPALPPQPTPQQQMRPAPATLPQPPLPQPPAAAAVPAVVAAPAAAAAAAPAAAAVDPENDCVNWRATADADTQLNYYYNVVTKTTQWTLPECVVLDNAPACRCGCANFAPQKVKIAKCATCSHYHVRGNMQQPQ